MHQGKVFGIGMSKTGTTTLGRCLEILGFNPHVGYRRDLNLLRKAAAGGFEQILAEAERWRSFEDAPWYHLFRELDQRFPGSKFILTVRRDSVTHARSSWEHGVRAGLQHGPCPAAYLAQKIAEYEAHNQAVSDYFKHRPGDLLVICWEQGDGWQKLCRFLDVPLPDAVLPHSNSGKSRVRWASGLQRVAGVPFAMHLLRVRWRLSRIPLLRSVRSLVSFPARQQ